jgi:formylglycine-generating enzyme
MSGELISQTAGMVEIASGTFRMGSDVANPEERPAHTAPVDGFWIDRPVVTNTDFAAFIAATDHLTLAERPRSGVLPRRRQSC